MPPAGFEPTISAGERPQTYALDRAATGTGRIRLSMYQYVKGPRNKAKRAAGLADLVSGTLQETGPRLTGVLLLERK